MEAELWVFRVEEGLGNACALIFPDDSAGVIDWGTERPEAYRALFERLGRRSEPWLRFIAASHAHADHTLGFEKLISDGVGNGIAIGRLLYPTPIAGSAHNFLRAARHLAKRLRIPMSSVSVSTFSGTAAAPVIADGVNPSNQDEGWCVRALAPADTAIANEEVMAERGSRTPGNPSSLILQFSFFDGAGACARGRAILPGDATSATLNYARQQSTASADFSLNSDALVIPHHGSSHNWVPWFQGLIEGFAMVSAPSGRPKHPSTQVLKELTTICGTGHTSGLFCTSYAGTCHATFGKGVTGAPNRLDPCFGDVGVRLSSSRPPEIMHCDNNGPYRRSFGHCRSR